MKSNTSAPVNHQKGFGAIEAIVALLVLVLIVGIGWYFVARRDDSKSNTALHTQKAETKTYTDTAKVYSLRHPATWSAKEAADCCEEAKDYTKISRSVLFVPPNKTDIFGYGVNVQADTTDGLAKQVEQNWADNKHQPQTKTINGHAAKYVKVTFKGDAENYIDHNYLLTENGATIFVTFREKYYHQSPPADWSAAQDLDAFNAILNSITFKQ